MFVWCFLVNGGSPPCIQKGKPQCQIWFLLFLFFLFPLKTKKKQSRKKKISRKKFLLFFFSRTFFFSCDFFFSNQPTLFFFFFFFQEQSVLSLLNLLQGLQRESKDCEKDHYKNKTRKPNNTKIPSLVSVMISLKQIRRLPGARRSHNGGPVVPQHLDIAPAN